MFGSNKKVVRIKAKGEESSTKICGEIPVADGVRFRDPFAAPKDAPDLSGQGQAQMRQSTAPADNSGRTVMTFTYKMSDEEIRLEKLSHAEKVAECEKELCSHIRDMLFQLRGSLALRNMPSETFEGMTRAIKLESTWEYIDMLKKELEEKDKEIRRLSSGG